MRTSTKEAIQREITAAQAIRDLAATEDRALTAEEKATFTAHMTRGVDLKKRDDEQDANNAQLSDLTSSIGADVAEEKAQERGDRLDPKSRNGSTKGQSIGRQFLESAEYKALIASVPEGRFGEKAHVQSQPFGVKTLLTGTNRTTDAGSLLVPDRLGMLDPFYQRPLTLRDLVTNGTTQTDVIEFVRLVSVTNAAAPVAEATTSAAPTQSASTGPLVNAVGGGYKPESAMVFEKATTTVRTIAHWIPATKRALSDVGQLQTLIDAFLLYGLEEEVEDQIISGAGTGENFQGIAGTSGIQTQAAHGAAPETILDTARMARRKVRIGGRSTPTAYAFNPLDWEAIELLKDANYRYFGQGPFAMMTPTLWGLPVVESEAVPAGTAYCADWSKAILWDREQASIQVTDTHADFFIRNLVAILAELRAAFAVLRPAAFVKITV